jgi:hypothetical protein
MSTGFYKEHSHKARDVHSRAQITALKYTHGKPGNCANRRRVNDFYSTKFTLWTRTWTTLMDFCKKKMSKFQNGKFTEKQPMEFYSLKKIP